MKYTIGSGAISCWLTLLEYLYSAVLLFYPSDVTSFEKMQEFDNALLKLQSTYSIMSQVCLK